MSDGHHVCLGRKCHPLKMLWWSPVATVFIKTYCYLIEKGRYFLYSAGGRNSWKYFGEFLCTDLIKSVFSDFWLQQLQASLVAAAKIISREEHKDDFLFASSCLCNYFSHKHKKIDN